MQWLLVVLAMLTSILFFYGVLQLLFLSNKRVEKRLKRYLNVNEPGKMDRKKVNIFVQIQLTKQKVREQVLTKKKSKKMEIQLQQAGLLLKPEEFFLFQMMAIPLAGGFFYLILGNFFAGILGFITGYYIPNYWLKKRQRERLAMFNEQLPEMLTTIIGSLRAGFSFPQALKTVAEESHNPIKDEIELVIREMQYGSSIDEALNTLKERMPSDDLDLMIQAILIQRQVGGNLATVLEKIVETIRERMKIQRQIVTLTAQGRLSGIVIGALPIILALVLYIIEPDYIGALFSNAIGYGLVGAGIVFGVIGFILIKKLTTIEV